MASSEDKLKWRALLLPRNPRIDEMKVKVFEKMDQHCFEIPRYQNQTYEVRLWCAFDNENAPWTSDYYARYFSTEASVPDRPPVFLHNGFFYNSEERTMLVFWLPLHKVEYTAPDFAYIVQSDLGKKALIVSNNSAIFLDWDPSIAATISIWSQNSLGLSVNSSELKVPILTNSERHQAQELEYHLKTDIMSWRPPKDEENLTDYMVFWCSAAKNNSQFCDDTRPLKKKRLEKSVNELHFNESVAQYNKAVVARYRDNSGGGMRWIGPSFSEKSSNILGFGTGFVLLLAVLARLSIVCFRRLQKCKEVEVELPVGILDAMDGWKESVETADTPPIITFPASVSPKGLVDIKSFLEETSRQEVEDTIVSPYVSVGPVL
ncbi:cytokine receptor-like [Drosophila takahashii]|uniref:cytokine receptor-like n=1 Tax=Drosophila takahashii TaxID=29030 RepID=UPI0038993080